jgi:hypothetical protein
MAVAPLNKFLTIAVPVAPGEQIVYTTPVGVSAILLYAQLQMWELILFPQYTFTHRRISSSQELLEILEILELLKM